MSLTACDDLPVTALLLGTLLFAPLAAGSTADTCRALLDKTERLACYDGAFGAAAGPVVEEDLTHLDRLIERRSELATDRFALTPHRPNYVLAGTYNKDADYDVYDQLPFAEDELDNLEDYEFKMQISLRTLLWPTLFGTPASLSAAYTQQSYWQVYAQDAPFRETDHEPELLLDVPMDHDVFGFRLKALTLALNHQSNGLIDPVSRSWNRIIGSAVFERGNFVTAVRPWVRLSEDDDDDENPNIERYMGQMELAFGYRWHEQSLAALIKNNLRSDNKSGLQIDWSFPLTLHVRGYLQYYTGYGENLIDGPEKTNRIGIGFMLSDWY